MKVIFKYTAISDFITSIVSDYKPFLFLLFIAIFLRFYKIEAFMTFLGDQGRDALIVKNIITFHHFPAVGPPSSVGQLYLGPFYYYLISPFILISNFDPVGLGLGVASIWIIGIIAAYIFVKKIANNKTTVIFSALIIFSAELIKLGRFSWNPNLLPIFGFFTIITLHKWILAKKRRYALILGALLSFSVQLHYLALLLGLVILIYGLIELYKSKYKKELLIQLGLIGFMFIFFLSPLIFFDIRHDYLNLKGFISLFSNDSSVGGGLYLVNLFVTIGYLIKNTINPNVPVWLGTTLFALVITIFYKLQKIKDNLFVNINLSTLVIYILGFALLDGSRFPHYFGTVYLSFYFLLAVIITSIVKSKYKNVVFPIIILIFVILQTYGYQFLLEKTGLSKIDYARRVAESFKGKVTKEPIQIVALPHTETDGHFRYFLNLEGYDVLSHDSNQKASELYVICREECLPTDDPHWQIATFENKLLQSSWKINDVTIFKIVHK